MSDDALRIIAALKKIRCLISDIIVAPQWSLSKISNVQEACHGDLVMIAE